MYYFNSKDKHSAISFAHKLQAMTDTFINNYNYSEIVIICIGTDCSTGDSLGPLIGYKLSRRTLSSLHIYGTLANPIHALNLEENLRKLKRLHSNALFIAVDASVGTSSHVGYVTLSDSPLLPGLGVHKSLPPVGDISITGIVNVSGMSDSLSLHVTRLSVVMRLADLICSGIAFLELCHRSSDLINGV